MIYVHSYFQIDLTSYIFKSIKHLKGNTFKHACTLFTKESKLRTCKHLLATCVGKKCFHRHGYILFIVRQ